MRSEGFASGLPEQNKRPRTLNDALADAELILKQKEQERLEAQHRRTARDEGWSKAQEEFGDVLDK